MYNYIYTHIHIYVLYIYMYCIVYIYVAIIDYWKPSFLLGNHSTRWTSIVMSSYQRIKWSQWTVLLVGGWLWKDVVLKPPQRHECIKWKRLSIYESIYESSYLSIKQSIYLFVCLPAFHYIILYHSCNASPSQPEHLSLVFPVSVSESLPPKRFFPKEHDD